MALGELRSQSALCGRSEGPCSFFFSSCAAEKKSFSRSAVNSGVFCTACLSSVFSSVSQAALSVQNPSLGEFGDSWIISAAHPAPCVSASLLPSREKPSGPLCPVPPRRNLPDGVSLREGLAQARLFRRAEIFSELVVSSGCGHRFGRPGGRGCRLVPVPRRGERERTSCLRTQAPAP